MDQIFNNSVEVYIHHKGRNAYEKLYKKIYNSDALNELCGISVRRGLPPSSGDFTYKASMMPSIYITFDSLKSTMAALIMLKIWTERVNSVYSFCSNYHIREMARQICSECILLNNY